MGAKQGGSPRTGRWGLLRLRYVIPALVFVLAGLLLLPAGWFSARAWDSLALVAGADPPQAAVDGRSVLLAADGTPIASFYRHNRVDVPLSAVAPVMQAAMLAAEDHRFYDHGAVDPIGIVRALATNARSGAINEGASTLTQQYVKNLRIAAADGDEDRIQAASAPTVSRKITEARYALEVERRLSKDEILSRYLNIAYFGAGAYGVEAAARRYFDSSAKELTLSQSAMLSGLVQTPTTDDPTKDPAAARAGRDRVLAQMVDDGSITTAQAREATAQPLELAVTTAPYGCEASSAPFFCDYALAELLQHPALGATPEARMERLLDGGLRITTTMDPAAQHAAQAAVDEHIESDNPIGSAIAMLQPGTGRVQAIALNHRYGEGEGQTELNYALDKAAGGGTGFQGGSTFKPFVLAAALEQGIEPDLSLSAPASITVSGFDKCDPEPDEQPQFPSYTVGNYDDEGFGELGMAEATARSVNTYFVQLAKRTGVCDPPELAERMGLERADRQPLDRYPSFVLGAQAVSPLSLAEAYATLAAKGRHCESTGVLRLETEAGRLLAERSPSCEQALPEEVAIGVTDLLKGVIGGDIEGRTGRDMAIDAPAAGKTGTTNDATAVWFAGYTDELAAAVWSGYPDASRPLKDVEVNGETYDTLFGGALPGPIWRDAMRGALEHR